MHSLEIFRNEKYLYIQRRINAQLTCKKRTAYTIQNNILNIKNTLHSIFSFTKSSSFDCDIYAVFIDKYDFSYQFQTFFFLRGFYFIVFDYIA